MVLTAKVAPSPPAPLPSEGEGSRSRLRKLRTQDSGLRTPSVNRGFSATEGFDQEGGDAGQEDEEGDAFGDGVAHPGVGVEAAGAEGVAVDQDADDLGGAVRGALRSGQDVDQ